jgi:hypothetical protein
MIGLWDGESVPSGWTELTSLHDYFIQFNEAGTGSTSGTGTINTTVSLASAGASHTHGYLDGAGGSYNGWSGSNSWAHTHSATAADRTYLPPYYALKLIQLTGQGG